MSDTGYVYVNDIFAGTLQKNKNGYIFTYDDAYYNSSETYPVSLTLPKTDKKYVSRALFPFFFGILSEGANKQVQCRILKIDPKDHFSLLLRTAHTETIGAVTVKDKKL
ncbi:MAG: HipA N-terminal domain-containing protein [Bacteroidia bacterium]|nr:HipA N-terminal domain-containing protein [Bacteroidia bacterium]